MKNAAIFRDVFRKMPKAGGIKKPDDMKCHPVQTVLLIRNRQRFSIAAWISTVAEFSAGEFWFGMVS